MGEVTFAGDGGKDVGDGNMKDVPSPGLQSGGPVVSPKGIGDGVTASGGYVDEDGDVPQGGGVQFAGSKGSDW
jgi:hypothetical protein